MLQKTAVAATAGGESRMAPSNVETAQVLKPFGREQRRLSQLALRSRARKVSSSPPAPAFAQISPLSRRSVSERRRGSVAGPGRPPRQTAREILRKAVDTIVLRYILDPSK
jgi:hypothetical protein